MRHRLATSLLGLLILLLSGADYLVMPESACAAIVSSATSGNWSSPSTWSGGNLPQTGDAVVISAADSITLDISTPRISDLVVNGKLFGGSDTINIQGQFTGFGTFSPGVGTVYFCDTLLQVLGAGTIRTYYDLLLSDTSLASPGRSLAIDLIIAHNFTCRFANDTAAISGKGSLEVYGSFLYLGSSATSWAGQITLRGSYGIHGRLDSSVTYYAGQLKNKLKASFFFPPLRIQKPDSNFLVHIGYGGHLDDTMHLARRAADTSIAVMSGTLDLGSGTITTGDSALPTDRPLVLIANGARIRTSAPLPIYGSSIYDSLHAPIYECDTNSTFEYYSDRLDVIDISYLTNNLTQKTYGNLVLSKVIASFRTNPVSVMGTLLIQSGTSVIPDPSSSQNSQSIIIRGNVINENGGESGSDGAGVRGCGMRSNGSDTWIFDAIGNHIKDTCRWSGPSQLGNVIVRPNTVLSVRFIDDRHCDSLDVVERLVEECGPCGAHVIGRIYSQTATQLDDQHPSDDIAGLGLTIGTGSDPVLGKTRVVRTSGYPPPGADQSLHPVLRYYNVLPENGPQQGVSNKLTMRTHCDELNGATLSDLHFWRTRNRGDAWMFSGLSSFDSDKLSFTWDTASVGFPNNSNGFYWTLSEGAIDLPLPVELSSFRAYATDFGVRLEWETASEINEAGYEIERSEANGAIKVISSYLSDPGLISRSKYGGQYSAADTMVTDGLLKYALISVSRDGIRTQLSAMQLIRSPDPVALELTDIAFSDGILRFFMAGGLSTAALEVYNISGALVFEGSHNCTSGSNTIPMLLPSGAYFAVVQSGDRRVSQKFVVH